MLADLVDHVIGVDPDRDRVTAAVVCANTGAEIDRGEFATTTGGYADALAWADERTSAETRVWSIEGTGSYGAGLAVTLGAGGEWVIEFDRPAAPAARDGAKSDGRRAASRSRGAGSHQVGHPQSARHPRGATHDDRRP